MPPRTMVCGVTPALIPELMADAKPINCLSIEIRPGHREPLPEDIAKMAESIETIGLVSPIGVRPGASAPGKTYRLVYGATRLRAWLTKFDGVGDPGADPEALKVYQRWHSIPAVVYPPEITDDTARLLELTENAIRTDPANKLEIVAEVTERNALLAKAQAEAEAAAGRAAEPAGGIVGGTTNNSPPPTIRNHQQIKRGRRDVSRWLKKVADETGMSLETLRDWFDAFTKAEGLTCTVGEAADRPEVQEQFGAYLRKRAAQDAAKAAEREEAKTQDAGTRRAKAEAQAKDKRRKAFSAAMAALTPDDWGFALGSFNAWAKALPAPLVVVAKPASKETDQ